jgi:secreted trypsin-like serine protease
MTGSRFLRLYLVLLAAGHAVSALDAMDEGESVASTTSRRNLNPRIVGGTKAEPTRHPYFTQLSISYLSYTAGCGGTLIAKDVVLTAAHCLTPESYWDSVWSIDTWVNSTGFFDSPYEYARSASQYLIHPSYDSETFANDIALIFLDDPVEKVPLVKINKDASAPAVGKAMTAIGLGYLKSPPVVKATYLMQVSMNALAGSSCSSLYGAPSFKNANQICAGNSKNTCQGDSGGPLLLKGTSASKDVQVGIVSYGLAAGCGLKPSAYTRVSKYSKWIDSNVCMYSNYPPATCR